MHKARSFLVVCAGVFLLALSYHLGVRSVEAKAPQRVTAASIVLSGGAVAFLAATGRVVHVALAGTFTRPDAMVLPDPVPGLAPIVAMGTNGGSALDHLGVYVMLEDGNIYIGDTARGGWMPVGFTRPGDVFIPPRATPR